ncbi:MAG: protein phosphatase 2C domain-containing protein [Cyanobacteria bacterium]|nr:protein phosphatase 2C domain-containing protein [Cyanobacteriota bacterium]
MINCFNPNCQVENPADQAICNACHWPLVKRYLWAVGSGALEFTGDRLVNERYQVLQPQLWLDTRPARSPLPLELAPELAEPYLTLSPFTTAIPQPFTYFTTATGAEVLLLEEIPVRLATPKDVAPTFFPTLTEAWATASALHQLTWLWQWARLWEPMAAARVSTTLLQGNLLRVDGADLRLLALQADTEPLTLQQLGDLWQPLLTTAQPALQAYLSPLITRLQGGAITAAALVYSLVRALETLCREEQRTAHWVTYSDQGPTRQRNEDACYPPSGTHQTVQVQASILTQPAPLVVVCDGIGGHQGGDVASKLAIDEVVGQLQTQLQTPDLSHDQLEAALKQAILAANQRISAENDQAQRQARDRMGTTLVLAVVYGARLYLAHLGDSRAYRIRPYSCRQLTLDDDVATREMRLGHNLYRDALLNPGAGSLVQALGMADSRHLHPTVQMHVLVEETLVLICSDGLSDNDLVERLWLQELAPLFAKPQQVPRFGQRLIQLANTHNGHDNVTVGLLYLSGQPSAKGPVLSPSLAIVDRPDTPIATAVVQPPPQITPAPKRGAWLWLMGALAVATLLGAVGIRFLRPATQAQAPEPASTPGERTTLSPSAPPPQPTGASTLEALAVGDVLQLQRLPDNSAAPTDALAITAEVPAAPPNPAVDQPKRSLPVGSQVEVVRRQKTPDNQLWVRLRVCTVPGEGSPVGETAPPAAVAAESTPTENLSFGGTSAQPGEEGWILDATLRQVSDRLQADSANPPCP